MNEVMVVGRQVLRVGQASLYDLIVDKLGSGDSITIEEAEHIWLTKVCRKVYDGVPHRTTYEPAQDGTNNWYAKDVPMDDEEVRFAALNWLTKNIGMLVIKGYLKVIPMIELTAERVTKHD